MTDATEPTVRYWRTVKSGNVKPIPVNAPKLTAALMDRGLHVEVVVMTPAELAAIKAEVWIDAVDHLDAAIPKSLYRAAHADNPYIESEE